MDLFPGVKPGQPTADYIGTIMDQNHFTRCHFPGIGRYSSRVGSIGILYVSKILQLSLEVLHC